MTRRYPNIERFLAGRHARALARLPKAAWLTADWQPKVLPHRRPIFQRNRLANSVRYRVGSLVVHHRAPWLLDAARALYPNLFPFLPSRD